MDSVTVRPGTSFSREVTVYTDDTQSELETLTEDVSFSVYDRPNGEQLITGAAVPDDDPSTGVISIALAPEDTEDLNDTNHVLYASVRYGTYIVDEFRLVVQ